MSFFRQLRDKPWDTDARAPEMIHPGLGDRGQTTRKGLLLFLAVVSTLFFMITFAYFETMAQINWTPLQEPRLLWLNTGLIILSSVFMQRASNLLNAGGEPQSAQRSLMLAGFLAVAFLVGQIMAWRELLAGGFFAATNPSVAFFYLITALHGLHLFGGISVLAVSVAESFQQKDSEKLLRTTKLCTTYWHYLLGVWLLMFGFLLVDYNGAINVVALCVGLLTGSP